MSELAAPVGRSDRIVAIDVLRGFAVLGILLINIQSFAMIGAAYLNPTANDKAEGWGFAVWAFSYLFGDLKFMAIFSMLFGAGIVLMSNSARARGVRPAPLHYRRQFWLLIIGLVHAHLIWYGDILVAYALLAMILFWFRRLRPRTLIILGVLSLAVAFGTMFLAGISMPYWEPAEIAAQADDWAPPAEVAAAEIEAYRGGWLSQLPVRSQAALELETFVFMVYLGWRVAGLMLVGMALYGLGVLSAARSDRFYRNLALIGLGLGLPIIAFGIVQNVAHGFSVEYSMFQGSLFNYVGSLGVALGYVAVVMLAVRRRWLPALQERLAATGRMALTNYIAQSLICTWIFYGHGLGWFESVSRPGQLGVVVAIWALQLIWSPWWLSRYRFGPLEWLWRTLTYLRVQPMARA